MNRYSAGCDLYQVGFIRGYNVEKAATHEDATVLSVTLPEAAARDLFI